MLLTFEGIAKFVDIDKSSRRTLIEARGTDKKGRGAAQAKVRLQLEPKGQSTSVLILTELQLSGSVAQIGRASGLIEEVSRHIVGEFANNLNRQIANGAVAKPAAEGMAAVEPPPLSAAPISGFGFAVRVLFSAITRLFKKLTGQA